MKHIFIFATFLLSFFDLFSQKPLAIGLEGGLNFADISPLDNSNPLVMGSSSLEPITGWTYGIPIQYNFYFKNGFGFVPDLSILTKLNYTDYRASFDYLFNDPIAADGEWLKLSYIKIPIEVKYCISAEMRNLFDPDHLTITPDQIDYHEGIGFYQSPFSINLFGGLVANIFSAEAHNAGFAYDHTVLSNAVDNISPYFISGEAGIEFGSGGFYFDFSYNKTFSSAYKSFDINMDGTRLSLVVLFYLTVNWCQPFLTFQ